MHRVKILLSIFGLSVVMLLAGCVVAPSAPSSSASLPQIDCLEKAQGWGNFANNGVRSNYFFVENQLIVTAPANAALIGEITKDFGLTPITYTMPITISNDAQEFQIQLFSLVGRNLYTETIQVACEINTKYAHQRIYADPNYMLSLAGHGPAVSAQWGWSEYSGNWVAIPNLVLNESLKINDHAYIHHWGWGENGINLSDSITLTGQGVPIAIMDSFSNISPIKLEELSKYNFLSDFDRAKFFEGFKSVLDNAGIENVDDYLFFNTLLSHGQFVEGIAMHVAKNSDMIEQPVVGTLGIGDVFTLITSVYEVRANRHQPLVINLSLGIHYPRRRCPMSGCLPNNRYTLGTYGLPDDIVPLEKTLKWAYEQGSVIVSAAGNIGLEKEKVGYFTIPSDYDFVIGVASSNIDGYPSCFSHLGDVYAPGGDGVGSNCDVLGGEESPVTDLDSILRLSILSKMRDKDGSEYHTMWAGTSFSAPMVSGLAALLLEKGDVEPNEVPAIIIRCAEQTGGGIDIAYTLTHYQNPDCR